MIQFTKDTDKRAIITAEWSYSDPSDLEGIRYKYKNKLLPVAWTDDPRINPRLLKRCGLINEPGGYEQIIVEEGFSGVTIHGQQNLARLKELGTHLNQYNSQVERLEQTTPSDRTPGR